MRVTYDVYTWLTNCLRRLVSAYAEAMHTAKRYTLADAHTQRES